MLNNTTKPAKSKLLLSCKKINLGRKSSYASGFTIVELLVVIVVIGILAAITIISYTGVSQRAIGASLQSDLASAKKQLQIYQTQNDAYPVEIDDCPTPAAGNLCISQSSGGNDFTNYSANNSTNPPTFTLDAVNGTTVYRVTNDSVPLAVAPPPPPTFVMGWGGTSIDIGNSLVQTSDGGFAVTGYTYSYTAGETDMFLAKYTSDGTLSWSKTWGGIWGDSGLSLVQTSDGGYAVTGQTSSYTAGNTDMFLAKYTSDGTLSWSKTWGGASHDMGYSLVQTSDDGFAVTGQTSSYTAGNFDMFLAKYTSDGTLSWSKTWGGASADYGKSLVQTSDDGFAVTGYTVSYTAGGDDMFLAKYTSDGTLSWSKTWGGASEDRGNYLVQTSDDGFAVTGYTFSYTAGSADMFLAKYASDGSLSWSKTWGGTSADFGQSLVQTSDGGYTVTGFTSSYTAGSYDMFLAKYTSDGTLSWSKTWGGASNDYGYSLVQTSDGGYAVAGETSSYTAGVADMFITKYTSDGTITNCASPMCQDRSVTGVDRSVTGVDRSVTGVDRSVTGVNRTVTSVNRTVTTNVIVAP